MTMTPGQKRYFEEQAKYAHVVIEPGRYVLKTDNRTYFYEVISVGDDSVTIRNQTDFIQEKTIHWCRKNLIRLE